MKNRTLYFGDNLEILRKKIAGKSFDYSVTKITRKFPITEENNPNQFKMKL